MDGSAMKKRGLYIQVDVLPVLPLGGPVGQNGLGHLFRCRSFVIGLVGFARLPLFRLPEPVREALDACFTGCDGL